MSHLVHRFQDTFVFPMHCIPLPIYDFVLTLCKPHKQIHYFQSKYYHASSAIAPPLRVAGLTFQATPSLIIQGSIDCHQEVTEQNPFRISTQ